MFKPAAPRPRRNQTKHVFGLERVQQGLTQGIDAFALQEHVGEKIHIEI